MRLLSAGEAINDYICLDKSAVMVYFARADCFNIAWWIGDAGVLRLGSRRTV